MSYRDYLLDRESPRAVLETEDSVFLVTSRRLLEYREFESPETEENSEWMRDLSMQEVVGVEVSTEPHRDAGVGRRLMEGLGLKDSEEEVEASVAVYTDAEAEEPGWRVDVEEGGDVEDVRGFVRALRKAAFTARQEM